MRPVGFAAGLFAIFSSVAVADRSLAVVGSIEAGAEYDSNPGHVEQITGDETVKGAPLLRLQGRIGVAWVPRLNHVLSFRAGGAAKQFATKPGRQENAFALDTMAGYQRGITKDTDLSLVARYQGVFGDALLGRGGGNQRVFSLVTLAPTWDHYLSDSSQILVRVTGSAFFYPPDRDQDFFGVGGTLRFTKTIRFDDQQTGLDLTPAISLKSMELIGAYRISVNRYRGNSLTDQCPPDALEPACILETEDHRRDVRHTFTTELSYSGSRIYGLQYQLQFTDSNSFGYSSLRHRLEASISTELPGSLLATLRGVLIYTAFLDPLLLTRDVQSQDFVAIDDENRNAMILHLARDIGEAWTIDARYAIYSNEFATDHVSFRRQIVFVGAMYRFSNR